MEGDRQDAFLDLVQIHQPGEQQRPHFADRGADGMALLSEQIPELHRIVAILPIGIADLGGAGGEGLVGLGRRIARHREPGEVALDVGDEGRDAGRRQPFDDALQCDGLAGAGRAGDQSVAIGALQLEDLRLAAAGADIDSRLRLAGHGRVPC